MERKIALLEEKIPEEKRFKKLTKFLPDMKTTEVYQWLKKVLEEFFSFSVENLKDKKWEEL